MTRQLINPSETFGDIVIDYSYVECTSACMTALAAFAAAHPRHRAHDISRAQDRGSRFVLKVRSAMHSSLFACALSTAHTARGHW